MPLLQKTTLLTLFFCVQLHFFAKSQTSRETLNTKIGAVSFDKNITGFHFAVIIKHRFVYSKNGKQDLNAPTPKTGFFIQAIENMDYKSAIGYIFELTHQFGNDNQAKTAASFKDTSFNIYGRKSYCSFFCIFDKTGKETSAMLIGFIPVKGDVILFLANDYTKGEYERRFLKTFQSIRLL